jgi:ribonuclease P protein component
MTGKLTYNRQEKLKSRKLLQQVFATAKSFSVFPVKVFYMPLENTAAARLQVGVGVSARNFKKAVDRNRIKRLLRECYRLNKLPLHALVYRKGAA